MEEEGRRSGHERVMPRQTPSKNGGGDPAGASNGGVLSKDPLSAAEEQGTPKGQPPGTGFKIGGRRSGAPKACA